MIYFDRIEVVNMLVPSAGRQLCYSAYWVIVPLRRNYNGSFCCSGGYRQELHC